MIVPLRENGKPVKGFEVGKKIRKIGMNSSDTGLLYFDEVRVPQRYRIGATGLEGLKVASDPEVEIGPAESRWVAVQLHIPYGSASAGSHPVFFEVHNTAGDDKVVEKSVFLVPR